MLSKDDNLLASSTATPPGTELMGKLLWTAAGWVAVRERHGDLAPFRQSRRSPRAGNGRQWSRQSGFSASSLIGTSSRSHRSTSFARARTVPAPLPRAGVNRRLRAYSSAATYRSDRSGTSQTPHPALTARRRLPSYQPHASKQERFIVRAINSLTCAMNFGKTTTILRTHQ
jgi:hypothetical protein